MRTNKLGWIAAITLGTLVTLSPLSQAAEGQGRGQGNRGQRGRGGIEARMKQMAETLKLTEEQKKKVKVLFENQRKKMTELRDVPREERREKWTKLREEFNTAFNKILTPEQQKQYAKMQKEARKRRGNRGQGEKRPPAK